MDMKAIKQMLESRNELEMAELMSESFVGRLNDVRQGFNPGCLKPVPQHQSLVGVRGETL